MALIKMIENRIYSSWVFIFLSSPSTWFPVNLQIIRTQKHRKIRK